MNQTAVNLRVERFDAEAVIRNWPWASLLLAPSVRVAGRKIDDVKLALLRDEMGLASLHVPRGAGLVVVQPVRLENVFACWIAYAAFLIEAGPKEWLRTVKAVVRHFEDLARESGCTEMRIGGRDWGRLMGYEQFELGWKKAL